MTMPPEKLQRFLISIPAMSVDEKMQWFLKIRAAKSAATKAHDAVDADFKLVMETIQNHMLADADKAGVTGFTAAGVGTSYTAETSKISIADDEAFRAFVLEKQDLDFFERRVSSKRVEGYIKEFKTNPPGLNIFRERIMRVRKAGDKLED